MSDSAPSVAKRATWLIWAGGGAAVLMVLLIASWWLLPRYAPGVASAIGTAIPPLTRPLADRCYRVGYDAYNDGVSSADPATKLTRLRCARAHFQVAQACYDQLHDEDPSDNDRANRLIETNMLYYAARKFLGAD